MHEVGQWVALLLLAVWLLLLYRLIFARIKVSHFAAASAVLIVLVPFFWLSNGITELTIARVGSLKTNFAAAATFLAQVTQLRNDLEPQIGTLKRDITDMKNFVANAKAEQSEITAKLQNIRTELPDVKVHTKTSEDRQHVEVSCDTGHVVAGSCIGIDNGGHMQAAVGPTIKNNDTIVCDRFGPTEMLVRGIAVCLTVTRRE
jgi:hypothetical protein